MGVLKKYGRDDDGTVIIWEKYYVGVLQSEDEIQGSVDAEIWISIDPQICRCRGRKI